MKYAENLNYKQTREWTVREIYGTLPIIPEGHAVVEFRPPTSEDLWLTAPALGSRVVCGNPSISEPRLILCKKAEVVRDVSHTHEIKLVDIYGVFAMELPSHLKYVAFRPPKSGEWFVSSAGIVLNQALSDWQQRDPRIIVEKI